MKARGAFKKEKNNDGGVAGAGHSVPGIEPELVSSHPPSVAHSPATA